MNNAVPLLNELFRKWSDAEIESIVPLPESGSYRQYYRITAGKKQVIGVYNHDNRENHAFIYLDKHLLMTGNKVPEVYISNLKKHVYLEQDLGEVTLLDYLEKVRMDTNSIEETLRIYKAVIDAMPGLQIEATHHLDYSNCYPRAEFDAQSMMWDLNYFKYCLLKPLKIGFYEQDLEDDFQMIVNWLMKADRNSFMFRDFQSRNIMIRENDLYFIDFQGGRNGPLQYDLASLLFEAKTHLSENIREQLLDHYLSVFSNRYSWFRPEVFLKYYFGFVYLRLMQAMGAYGFRGYIERKPLFLQSLPHAIQILTWLTHKEPFPLKLNSLPDVFEQLISQPQTKEYKTMHDVLKVSLNSFSFVNGIPHEHSDHPGGFVFDCRFITNPAQFEKYKHLTGKDKPVIEFLASKSDVKTFIKNVCRIIDQSVASSRKKRLHDLTINFGCTGGKHRSVFISEQIAHYLKKYPDLHIEIRHYELEKARQQ
jgi:aminoglycoside/choline kinase family phosphotransferase